MQDDGPDTSPTERQQKAQARPSRKSKGAGVKKPRGGKSPGGGSDRGGGKGKSKAKQRHEHKGPRKR